MYFPSVGKFITTQLVHLYLLSYENWEDVFLEKNVNIIFNNFSEFSIQVFPLINHNFLIIKNHG
jgi:hypothetical protein